MSLIDMQMIHKGDDVVGMLGRAPLEAAASRSAMPSEVREIACVLALEVQDLTRKCQYPP
jgi:hypothetical protein